MRSPQSQEARQSDKQARNLRLSIVAGLVIVAAIGAAVLWWPDGAAPEAGGGSAPSAEADPPAMMSAVGEALKDQGTISGYKVVGGDKALDLTLRAETPEDPHAVAQATCDALQGKVEPGWTVRVYPPEGGAAAADCSI
jgi:hypothetical protein